jgi:hypothetical protein
MPGTGMGFSETNEMRLNYGLKTMRSLPLVWALPQNEIGGRQTMSGVWVEELWTYPAHAQWYVVH